MFSCFPWRHLITYRPGSGVLSRVGTPRETWKLISSPAADLRTGGFCRDAQRDAPPPRFLDYYRHLGVGRFVIVENNSRMRRRSFLLPKMTFAFMPPPAFHRKGSWLNYLLRKHGAGRWCLGLMRTAHRLSIIRPRAARGFMPLSGGGGEPMRFMRFLLDLYPKGADFGDGICPRIRLF